jgi:hypothetical protein
LDSKDDDFSVGGKVSTGGPGPDWMMVGSDHLRTPEKILWRWNVHAVAILMGYIIMVGDGWSFKYQNGHDVEI